jgi:ferric-dicitrate binding protein FerR (iron transport regulator)
MKRVVDLTLKLADGTATEAEVRELERLCESDRRARRLHLEMMEIEASLRASQADTSAADRSLEEERTVNAVLAGVRLIPPPRPELSRFAARPVWAVVALAGLAASVGVLIGPRVSGKRRAGATAPLAFGRSRAPREVGPLVPAPRPAGWSSAPVRIGPADALGVSRLELDDGLALEIRGRTVVRAIEVAGNGTRRVLVGDGVVAIEATTDARGALSVVTPHAEVAVRARKALIAVEPAATRIDVHEGTASVKRPDGHRLELGPRQSALVSAEEGLSSAPLPALLFVKGESTGRHPADLMDGALVRHLEGLGFVVEAVDEGELQAGHIEGKALVVISPSTSEILGARIEDLSLAAAEVPVLCSRPHLYAELSMTPPGQEGHFTSNATRLEVVAPRHPIAAGLTGPLQVTRAPGTLGWGQPGPGAVRVATFPDKNKRDLAVIFAYERGAPMAGSVTRAPARRVGFFMHPDLAPYLTDSGWALLDAAVRWAADEHP